jgi:hypothetical protein
MQYPTIEEVNVANREEIYRWFLLLPFPRKVKTGKGKTMRYIIEPSGGTETMLAIYGRWLELGGSDVEIRNKVLREKVIK